VIETTIFKENQIEINMMNDERTISYEVPIDDEISFKTKKSTNNSTPSFLTQEKDDNYNNNDGLQNISTSLTPIHKEKKSFLSRVKNVFSPAPKNLSNSFSGNKTKPNVASPLSDHKGNNVKVVESMSNRKNNLIIDESMKENSSNNINLNSPILNQNNKNTEYFSLGKQQFQSSLASPATLESSTPIFCLDSTVSPSASLNNDNDTSPCKIIHTIKLEDIEDKENSDDEEEGGECSLLSCMYPHSSSPILSPKIEVMLDSNINHQSKDDTRRISLDLCMNSTLI
jgi:hypothetical protein